MIGMKRGYADIWPIIGAALLVLIAVVVLLAFFSRGTQKAETGFSACETTGGKCVDVGTCRDKEGGTPSSFFSCTTEEGRPDPDKECCLGVKKAVA